MWLASSTGCKASSLSGAEVSFSCEKGEERSVQKQKQLLNLSAAALKRPHGRPEKQRYCVLAAV